MAKVVTIAGSPSSLSRTSTLMEFAKQQLERAGHAVDAIVVRNLNAEELIFGQFDGASIAPSRALVEAAKGVIIATPVYKAAYSGVLKTFLDILPPNALSNKVVLPIVSGGAPIHMLSLDYALKPVLAALGASQILNGLFLIDNQFDYKDGLRFIVPEVEEKFRAALSEFAMLLGNHTSPL